MANNVNETKNARSPISAEFPVRMTHADGRFMVVGDAIAFGYYLAAGFTVAGRQGDLTNPDSLRALSPGERELAAAAVAEAVAILRAFVWVASTFTGDGADGPPPPGVNTDFGRMVRAGRLAIEAVTGEPVRKR